MPKPVAFIPGHEYVRSELHGAYGGQSQYGISTPARFPLVFLFSGPSGALYGYEDGWTTDGLYRYSGEGQTGDMTMTGGNRAILEHAEKGEDLHLFESATDGRVRYVGHMVHVAHEWTKAADGAGNERDAVLFYLGPIEEFQAGTASPHEESADEKLPGGDLAALRELARATAGTEWAELAERRRLVRRRSQAIRLYALGRAGGTCEACSKRAPFQTPKGQPFLEVHHLRRLGDGGPDDPEWVAAVCPNCHRRAHYSGDADQFNDGIVDRVRARESTGV
jgi:5-methylcytosine-specific restriction protein A